GAIWMDPEKTTPYELFQYLRNIEDADVENCLKLLTFLPMEEVRALSALEGSEINKAKEILAFEFTKIVHGAGEADKALETAKALFSGGNNTENIPTTEMDASEFEEGVLILDLMLKLELVSSKGEGRRLIQQNGVSVNDVVLEDFNRLITKDDFIDGDLMIRKGKKVYHRVKLK
ncbi:MAG: tyrosine--tRNA ligase, partial [Bacillota bacterium]|nr:tyrosine--tRNA ligase [Bacillota bacterium]